MIDFPTLFPSLVKYIPNWMEKFYPRIAQFARGEGYPCGNKGVFIPRRNKCWTHPKTGQRMRKPLTYQLYQDAKEKSQRSKTEKGRTALANREQSFRDKAREKVKGWQNKTPESDATKRAIADIGKVKSGQILLNPKEGYRLSTSGRNDELFSLSNPNISVQQGGRLHQKKLTEKEAVDFLSDKYKSKLETKSDLKPSLNSTGVKGAVGKSVDQQYKDIIAKSKDPVETEKALGEALLGGSLWNAEKREYDRDVSDLRDGKVKKGYESYTQGNINKYKPIVDNEKFIEERRKAIDSGDFQTKKEVEIYLHKKIQAKNNKPYDYFDSPEYEKEYEKVNGILENKELPPPLTGKISGKDLKQSVIPGDKLLVKKTTYGFTDNKPRGYEISSGGEIVKVGIKNIKTRSKGNYMGRPYDNEGLVSMSEVSHVIRDGKRYKVDDSDSSPNDLGVQEKATTKRRTKKKDFNSHLNITEFGKPGCCCDASKPLRRRKTKQTPRLKRRGTRYA
jgi:hypothetical protein